MTGKGLPVKRVQIDMTEKALARLQWIVDETGAMGFADTIRTSLEVYEQLVILKKDGKRILFEDPKTGQQGPIIR